MESTAINSIYVVYCVSDYTNITVTSLMKSFFREDEAIKYVELMQKLSNESNLDYIIESWYYKELDIE